MVYKDILTLFQVLINMLSFSISISLHHRREELQKIKQLILIQFGAKREGRINQLSNLFLSRNHRLDLHFHSLSILALNMLHTAQTHEFSIHHNAQLSAQSFSFFHQMGRQDNRRLFLLSSDSRNHVPHEPSRFRVHTSGRFVQKHHLRVAQCGNRRRQFSLITSGQSHGQGIAVLHQVKFFQLGLDDRVSDIVGETPHAGVELQMFSD